MNDPAKYLITVVWPDGSESTATGDVFVRSAELVKSALRILGGTVVESSSVLDLDAVPGGGAK